MESKEAAQQQLRTLAELKAATQVEARRTPKWSAPVFVIALIAFIFAARVRPIPATACWIVFVALWVMLGRRGHRATPLPALPRREASAFLVAFVLVLVVAGALGSSAIAGLASGLVGAIAGVRAAWRGSHQ